MGARQRRHRRTALVAALFAVCAFGSVPALAQVDLGPDVTVPWPLGGGGEGSSPDPTTTTTTAAPPATTPTSMATTTAPAPASVAPPSAGAPTETARRSTTTPDRRPSTVHSSPAGPDQAYDIAPAAADDRPAIARLRQVSLPAARQFGFPLALAVLVLAFLAVQGRLDARDPKLAVAPLSVDDDLLPFT